MSARSVWKGSLSIGLVTVPVKLYKATDERSNETAMHQTHGACNHQLKQKMFCAHCNADVPFSDISKGVDNGDGTFTVLTTEELDSIKPDSSDHIVVEAFVPVEQVTNPLWIENTYYLAPDGKPAHVPYVTIHAAMAANKRAAQGLLTIYGRERVVTIVPNGSVFVVQLMRTKSLVRDSSELPSYIAPGAIKVESTQLKLAQQLIESLADDFDPTDYEDGYVTDWKALVESKRSGKPVAAKEIKAAAAEAGDLMSALRASLDAKKPAVKKIAKPVQAKGKSSRKAS